MFEETLLILKSDYLTKRKHVLLYLLEKGFKIQGNRKLLFSPEQAAQFYKDLSEDKSFMLQVILLSKGNVEAFILTKEDAINQLINTMICFFGDSVTMERHVHVSKTAEAAKHEISFIFPNYLPEPVPVFEKSKFCADKDLVGAMIQQLFHIMNDPEFKEGRKSWRVLLSEWLKKTNPILPQITNECSFKSSLDHEEKGQQTEIAGITADLFRLPAAQIKKAKGKSKRTAPTSVSAQASMRSTTSRSASSVLSTSIGSSNVLSSTSCITCSFFETSSECKEEPCEELSEKLRGRTQPLPRAPSSTSSTARSICACHEGSMESETKVEKSSDIPRLEYENTSSEPDMTGALIQAQMIAAKDYSQVEPEGEFVGVVDAKVEAMTEFEAEGDLMLGEGEDHQVEAEDAAAAEEAAAGEGN